MSVFIVAEMSGNHNGSLKLAIETIKAAKEAGADAIKLQTYTADTLTLDCDSPDFMANPKGLWAGQRLHDVYKVAYTPWEWHKELFHVAKEEGLVCFSSPFDNTAVDLLEELDCTMYKIASPEITDIGLMEYASKTGKPIILSTGIAYEEDMQLAIDTCRNSGCNDITLLKCTTAYPTPLEVCNLSMIPEFAKRFNVKAGLSDPTMGWIAPVVATTLGATMIEKHFIIDRNMGGVDSAFSMSKDEFSEMVKHVRDAEKCIGKVSFEPTETMITGRRVARSLYVAEDVKEGDVLTAKNVRSVRPGFGLHPKYLPEVIGKRFVKSATKGERFDLGMVE
ncbi:MAG: pseudaminic acid synthase [Bacteroidaceae bacterium]|nr:pseudaminic acid synthase [Bacteroidaceae bacterium]